jgi:glycerophosphoryl diester phosphodiesterase
MMEVQGHRGARGLFPENTLEGFAAAMSRGIRHFELDVAVTRDRVPVVHHDPALHPDIARTPDGAWLSSRGPLIKGLTSAELARFDVGRLRPGSAYAASYPAQQPMDGARIPTLAAVLALGAHVTIEMKVIADYPEWTVPAEEMAALVAEAIDAADATDRVTVSSFAWRAVRCMRRLRPAIPLAWLTEARTAAAAELWWDGATPAAHGGSVARAVAAEGGATWSPHHPDLDQTQLDEAHELGLCVVPWTVNDSTDMARLAAWGVDGLISDRPDLWSGRDQK